MRHLGKGLCKYRCMRLQEADPHRRLYSQGFLQVSVHAFAGAHPAQEAMHAQPALSTPAVQTLLQIYIQQPRAPASLPLHKAEAAETSGELSKQRSMARTLSRAASDFVTLPLRMTQQLLWAPAASGSPLADSALHLLLLLLHTSAPQGHASHGTFRDALQVCVAHACSWF